MPDWRKGNQLVVSPRTKLVKIWTETEGKGMEGSGKIQEIIDDVKMFSNNHECFHPGKNEMGNMIEWEKQRRSS